MLSDFDLRQLLLDDMKGFPHPRPNLPSMGHSIWSNTHALEPRRCFSFLFFFLEITSSPRYSDYSGAAFSPKHKSALRIQFQQQQSMLSAYHLPIQSMLSAYQLITYKYHPLPRLPCLWFPLPNGCPPGELILSLN